MRSGGGGRRAAASASPLLPSDDEALSWQQFTELVKGLWADRADDPPPLAAPSLRRAVKLKGSRRKVADQASQRAER